MAGKKKKASNANSDGKGKSSLLKMEIGGSSKQTKNYPTKKTMNLAKREKPKTAPSVLALALVLIVAVVFCITKFGVIDQLAAVSSAQVVVSQNQEILASMNEKLTDYDSVEEQHRLYSYGYLSEEEALLVDRIGALEVVEHKIMSIASVTNISITDNTLSVEFSGITLARIATLVTELDAMPTVANVSVYTASSEGEDTASSNQLVAASMVIMFQQASGGEAA